jgi:hypothetical protein
VTPDDARLIGASDIGAIFQVSEWSGWISLWARVVHGIQWGGNQATAEGLLSEGYHRALYSLHTGYALEGPPPAPLRHPLLPWARCSPDDTALGTPDGRRGVELKQARRSLGWGAEGTDEVPLVYWLQVQMQGGFCTEVGHWDSPDVDVSVLLYGERRHYHVQHEPEAWERIQAACERFWVDFVVPQRCPEGANMRVLERDCEALAALFPEPAPKAEPLPWEALSDGQRSVVEKWLLANDARAKWQSEEVALGGQVRILLKDVPGLLLPDGRVDYKVTKAGRPLVARRSDT